MSLETVDKDGRFIVLVVLGLFAIGGGVVLLARCDAKAASQNPTSGLIRPGHGDLLVWDDPAHNVRCYASNNGAALSCIALAAADGGAR